MKRTTFFSFLSCSLVCCVLWGGEISSAADNAATVFIYHKFGEGEYPTTNVAVDRFTQQMQFLKDNDYQVIPLTELVASLQGTGEALPPKTAVITIDDGYASTYTNAWPILQKYNYPFTVFLYVKAVESGYRNFLTWTQVREMSAAGVDFQTHTYSHHRLGSWPEGLDEKGYRAWISADMIKGYRLMAERLERKPRFLALPYGEYNTIVLEEAQKSGFAAVCTQDPGAVGPATDPFRIPREPILGTEWSTLDHFKEVLERVNLPLTNLYPPFVPFTNTVPDRFCATVTDAKRYMAGTFGIYVSELGWRSAVVDGSRVCMENQVSLARRSNRVVVSARQKESGKTALHYWLLINPKTPAPAD